MKYEDFSKLNETAKKVMNKKGYPYCRINRVVGDNAYVVILAPNQPELETMYTVEEIIKSVAKCGCALSNPSKLRGHSVLMGM